MPFLVNQPAEPNGYAQVEENGHEETDLVQTSMQQEVSIKKKKKNVMLILKIELLTLQELSSSTHEQMSCETKEVITTSTTSSVQMESSQTSSQTVTQQSSSCECYYGCLLYTSPSPRDRQKSRMPSSA